VTSPIQAENRLAKRALALRHDNLDPTRRRGELAKAALNQLVSDESVSCRQKIVELEEIQRGIDADVVALSVQVPVEPRPVGTRRAGS
jgi:hypothetical protein